MVYSSCPHVIAITETWFTSDILNNEILPSGYSIYRCDRTRRGGGVMLCVDARLPSRIVSILPNLETIIVVISGDTEFNVCLSYLPPNATKDTIEGLYTVIGDMANASNAIILGDFNCPDVDWVSLTADTSKTSIFCDLLFDNNLTQLVLSPTQRGEYTGSYHYQLRRLDQQY